MTQRPRQPRQGARHPYFMISYTDLFGAQRAKLVPAAAIADMQKDGAGFAGFATWLDMTPAHPDLFAMPDAAAVIQLPWKPDVAWVAADCVMDDKPVAQAPRVVLKKRGRRGRRARACTSRPASRPSSS